MPIKSLKILTRVIIPLHRVWKVNSLKYYFGTGQGYTFRKSLGKTMKTLRKMPVFVPAKLRFRDLIWMLVAIVIVLLVSFLSPSKAGAQNLTVECDTSAVKIKGAEVGGITAKGVFSQALITICRNSSHDKAASSGKDMVWTNSFYFLRIISLKCRYFNH